MTVNVGTIDRVVRAIVGVVLLWLAFGTGMESAVLKYGAAIVGIVLLATAALRTCPAYSIFGIRTSRT